MKNTPHKTPGTKQERRVFIALYRGLNVGGHNSVKMPALCALHQRLGHTHVRHYIQSGNIVFSAEDTPAAIAENLAAAFAAEFGFAGRVLLLTAEELQQVAAQNPYAREAAANPKSVHAALCQGAPNEESLRALLKKTAGPESFTIKHRTLYLHVPPGVGNSKFAAAMEKAAATPLTARNWRTIQKLCDMTR